MKTLPFQGGGGENQKGKKKMLSKKVKPQKPQGGNEVYRKNEGRGSFGGRVAAELASRQLEVHSRPGWDPEWYAGGHFLLFV